MERPEQRILIYSDDSDLIDRLVDVCEESNESNLRIAIARSENELDSLMESIEFGLAFVSMADWKSERILDQVSFSLSPRPTIAIVESADSLSLLHAMRNGADGVFTVPELQTDTGPLVYCLDRQLKRAAAIAKVNYLTEVLSRSLEELKADQTAARQIQERLLPPPDQTIDGINCTYQLKPSMLLSGDFVDLIPLKDNKLLFYLADVSGHGASSALVTVLLKNMTNLLLRSYNAGDSDLLEDPEGILQHVNRELIAASLGKHLTMFVGILDTDNISLNYAVGGHHPMPVLVNSNKTEFLKGRGMPLGLFEETLFDQHQIVLPEKFQLFLFSDGILELIDGDSLLDKEDNLLNLCGAPNASPETIIDSLDFDEQLSPDDVAVMRISR